MSIMEQMKQQNDLRKALLDRAGMIDGQIEEDFEFPFRPLALKRKNPRVTQMLGDANPLSGDELEDLKQYLKISRGEA